MKAVIEKPAAQIGMEFDYEPELNIGRRVDLRQAIAIRIELERMPATVFAEQSRVERKC